MAHFVLATGTDQGRKHELVGTEWIMGRLPECQIVINAGSVSRQHAKVTVASGAFFIEDLKSRNKTLRQRSPARGERTLPAQRRRSRQDLRHRVRLSCDRSVAVLPVPPPTFPESRPVGPAVEIFDPLAGGSSTVMGKLDVSSGRMPLHVTSSPEVRLQAMIEITQSLAKTLALDDVLPQVLNSCFKMFVQADRGLIVLKTESGELIARWTKTRRPNQEDTIRISRSIINKVIDSKEAILLADAANDSQFAMSQSVADLRLRSAMCAPLIDSAGKAFGVLQIDTVDQRGRFKADDLEILVSIASQAAIAIDNARLYDQALQKKAMQRDLELAREVQKSFLPNTYPDLPGYRFFHYYEPAAWIGGDYYDYIPLRDGRLAVIVADVVGHGVPAALLMAKLSAEARYCFVSESELGHAVSRLNHRITTLGLDRFITMILVVIDPTTHEVSVVSAGHMAPMVRRENGQIEEPGERKGGFPLGVMDDVEYEIVTTRIEPGEVFVLYTDGINESCDEQEPPVQYGTDRLRKFLMKSSAVPAEMGQRLVDDVRANMGSGPQDDDMCIVCVGRE